jgi:hypothetical protein
MTPLAEILDQKGEGNLLGSISHSMQLTVLLTKLILLVHGITSISTSLRLSINLFLLVNHNTNLGIFFCCYTVPWEIHLGKCFIARNKSPTNKYSIGKFIMVLLGSYYSDK